MLVPNLAPASHLVGQVNALYADPGCCGDAGITAAANVVDPKERKLFEAFARARHENPNRSDVATIQSPEWMALYRHIASGLIGGAEKGYQEGAGKKLSQLKPGSSDELMLEKLRTNLHFFSAQKNYHLLVDLNKQLTDQKGNLRPWGDFKKEALKLSGQYNVVWLRTEYNAAVGASQMAAKWQRMTSGVTDDIYLRYDTAGDRRVRPAHRKLDGITLPVDDPFWSVYYPPSAWNCRCDVTEVLRSKAKKTELGDRELPDVKPGFRTNVGKTGEIFTADHPYFSNTPPAIASAIEKLVTDAQHDQGLGEQYKADRERVFAEAHMQVALRKVQRDFKGVMTKLTDEEKAVIHDYTGNGFGVNRHLSGAEPLRPFDESYARLLNRALRKLPAFPEETVYRTAYLSSLKKLDRYVPGEMVTEPWFTSTTYDPVQDVGEAKFIILNKTGRLIKSISDFPGENEVLIPAGARFKVEGKEIINNLTHVYLTEL